MQWMLLLSLLLVVICASGERFNIHSPTPEWFEKGKHVPGNPKLNQLLANLGKDEFLLRNSLADQLLHNPTLASMRSQLIQKEDDIISAIDGQCLLDTAKFVMDLINGSLYTIMVLDSYGRTDSGVFSGNTRWMGDFDQCTWIDFETSASTKFKGKHCRAYFTYPLGGSTNYESGVCVPDSCGEDAALLYATVILPILGVVSPTLRGSSCFTEKSYSGGDIAALVILSFFCLMCLIGTIVDIVLHKDVVLRSQLFGRILISFSWLTNGRKLLSAKASSGQLSCLNGLRTISMFWVILGHSTFFPLPWTHNINSVFFRMFNTFEFQGILNADVSVDTFFFLSGLLVSYLTLKAFAKVSPLKPQFWGLYYFHRFWRLTPVYMLCLMFWATLMLHIPTGPRGRDMDGVTGPCDYWWTNLLYVNNFYPYEGNNGLTCFGHSWYLANDMQFYILSPIFILLFHYFWVAGVILCSLLVVACVIATGVLANKYQIYPDYAATPESARIEILMYVRPYFRCMPYLIGLVIGWTLIKYKKGVKMHWAVATVGWIFATGSAMALMYGLLPYRDWSATLNIDLGITYFTMKRLTFSAAVAWVTFASLNGYGGPVNWFLSWNIWIPLGRLSYCAYLVHPIFMYAYLVNKKQGFHMDAQSIAEFFIVSVVCSYALATIVSLTLESPFMALEKIFLGGSRTGVKPTAPKQDPTAADDMHKQQMIHIGNPIVYMNHGYTGPHQVKGIDPPDAHPILVVNGHIAHTNNLSHLQGDVMTVAPDSLVINGNLEATKSDLVTADGHVEHF